MCSKETKTPLTQLARAQAQHKEKHGVLSVTDPVFQGSNLSNRYEDDR
jgi:hypothetical protein